MNEAPAAPNRDDKTVADFGQEWKRYDQSNLAAAELRDLFESYFAIFPWASLPIGAQGFDAGCGSGRWAALVAPRVGHLHCVDASTDALAVARKRLEGATNVSFHLASLDAMPFDDGSMDFGYSLGVLHHLPDTQAGLESCVRKLKPGAPFLLYIYYAFDNRPVWFRTLWRASDLLRRALSRAPFRVKSLITEIIAALVYWPLARVALIAETLGLRVETFPLSAYRRRSFYAMRTDALDRFGTRLEHRFTAAQIRAMMEQAGLESIVFSDRVPYWCAVGRRRGLEIATARKPWSSSPPI